MAVTTSAPDIIVPRGTPPERVAAPATDAIDRIRQMLDGCDTTNRNDLLVIAIVALIDAGVNTRPRIIGAARSLGFDRAHAGAVLGRSEGSNPARHRWQRGADGVYRLHAA